MNCRAEPTMEILENNIFTSRDEFRHIPTQLAEVINAKTTDT